MNAVHRHLALLSAAWLLAGGAFAQETVRNVRVRLEDGPELDERAVLAFVSVKPGLPFSAEAVSRDVDELQKAKRYAFVQVEREQVPGGVDVVYVVRQRPRIRRLVVEGSSHFGNAKIRELLNLGVGDLVDDGLMAERVVKVREDYRKELFPRARVSWTIENDPKTGTADVKVKVEEGDRALVTALRVPRTPGVSTRQVRRRMGWGVDDFLATHVPFWYRLFGGYSVDRLPEAREAARGVYLDAGYLDAAVGEPEVGELDGVGVEASLPVQAGPLYRVGQIRLVGTQIFSNEQVMATATNLAQAAPASMAAIERNRQALQEFYGSRGRIDTQVEYDLVPRVGEPVVDVTYRVKESDIAYIRDVNVRGLTRTRDKVVRRELTVYPGEIYNTVKVRRSERRIRNLGYFDTVAAIPEETAEPYRYDLTLQVAEARPGNIMAGVGYSSIDDLVFFVELTQGNFDLSRLLHWPPVGAGQKLRLRGQLGTKRTDLEMSFIEPWFLDRKLALGVDLFRRDNRYYSDEYKQRETGGELSLGRALDPYDINRATLAYGIETIDIYDVDEDASDTIKAEEGSQQKNYMSLRLTHLTLDNPFVATRGNRTTLNGTVAGGPFGGEVQLYHLEARSSQYLPVWWDHVFNLRGSIGVVENWGDGERVPIFDRLFLGGANTLRLNFSYSPTDVIEEGIRRLGRAIDRAAKG